MLLCHVNCFWDFALRFFASLRLRGDKIRGEPDKVGLVFIWYLDNADNNFMRIAVFVQQTELYHWIFLSQVILHMRDLVVKQMFLDVFAKDLEGIREINFQRTRIIG